MKLSDAQNPETWQVGDQIKWLEDNSIGTVTEKGLAGIKIEWPDGTYGHVGRHSNGDGSFEKVSNAIPPQPAA